MSSAKIGQFSTILPCFTLFKISVKLPLMCLMNLGVFFWREGRAIIMSRIK